MSHVGPKRGYHLRHVCTLRVPRRDSMNRKREPQIVHTWLAGCAARSCYPGPLTKASKSEHEIDRTYLRARPVNEDVPVPMIFGRGRTRKAYQLRDRVSEQERFYIESHYHTMVTGDFEKAREVYEIWAQTQPIGALSHLGLGRAYAMQGDTGKARNAYADFLKLWKDADPDIPILQQANAEYAKLQ